jgi:UDP-galactopyranose mutase
VIDLEVGKKRMDIDILIAGAGVVGSVAAERAASKGYKVLIVEKRNHIAGNCYDEFFKNGVLVHKYGPHYFRTNDENLLSYLSRFTDWIPGNYIVKSVIDGHLYPFPINLTTLEEFFHLPSLSPEDATRLLLTKQIKYDVPKNSEEFVLSRVGDELYRAFYLGYTLKQWEKHPKELDASVCGRIPVRLNRDERYVDHKYQLMPKEGYTKMFERILEHNNICVLTSTPYQKIKNTMRPKVATIYCGPLDEYFDFCFGKLSWRSLRFEFKIEKQALVQPCVQINYPNENSYTRTVEIKHVTRQAHPETVVSYEYPIDGEEPYYPVPTSDNKIIRMYENLAKKETLQNRVFFAGRLARYKYINMDEAFLEGLQLLEHIEKGN